MWWFQSSGQHFVKNISLHHHHRHHHHTEINSIVFNFFLNIWASFSRHIYINIYIYIYIYLNTKICFLLFQVSEAGKYLGTQI